MFFRPFAIELIIKFLPVAFFLFPFLSSAMERKHKPFIHVAAGDFVMICFQSLLNIRIKHRDSFRFDLIFGPIIESV
jgi:hypothetical protein